jgi:NADP-dependent 3-hydroxy acid dehydrogenase YdfG
MTSSPEGLEGRVAIEGDAAAADTAKRAVEAALGRWQRIDILVNNAGHITGTIFPVDGGFTTR